MVSQADKGHAFRALHERSEAFVMPNPWDVGSARLLEGLGFKALATTSGGFALSRGQADGDPGRDPVLAHAAELAKATELPISGDLENGFGDAPQACADAILRAAAAGLVGGSIEDYTGRKEQPLYELAHATERVRAAVEAARGVGFPFTLTARAEGMLRGPHDLADVIRRLQAFQEAGADVLFAPAVATREDLATILRETDRPLSVLAKLGGLELTVAELQDLGVRRISVGGYLAQVAYGALLHGAKEILEHGTFDFVAEAARARDARKLLKR